MRCNNGSRATKSMQRDKVNQSSEFRRAAHMPLKLNREELNKLNIVEICDEILNPTQHMSLRLSATLMVGVANVYQQKVNLLYDDLPSFQEENEEVSMVRPAPGKSRSKRKAVMLPENEEDNIGGDEELTFDNLDELHINQDLQNDLAHDYHTANAEDISLIDDFETNQDNTSMHNHFERFDIEGDDETQFTAQENTSTLNILTVCPPRQETHHESEEIPEQHPEDQVNKQPDEGKKNQGPVVQGPKRKRVKRTPALVLDDEQTIIGNAPYKSWLENCDDIVRKKRERSELMELPPAVIVDKLFSSRIPLLEQWKSTQPPHDSPSGENSTLRPPETSSFPAGGLHDQDGRGHDVNDNIELPEDNVPTAPPNANVVEERRSLPSLGSGGATHSSDINSGRHSPGGLEAGSEENGPLLDPITDSIQIFDIEGDDETEFTAQENTCTLNILTVCPPRQETHHESEEIPEQHPEDQVNKQPDEGRKNQGPVVQGPKRKRVRRTPALVIDEKRNIISDKRYESWKGNCDNILRRKREISELMELPATVIVDKLFSSRIPLLEQWKSTQPPHDSPSGENSTLQPLETSSFPAGGLHDQDGRGHDLNNNIELPEDNVPTTPPNSFTDNTAPPNADVVEERRSLPSLGLGGAMHSSDINSGSHSPGGQEAASEENGLLHDPITDSFKMQLKSFFDTPNSSKLQSLNQLVAGMNKQRAASLFYRTCVLATKKYIKVDQEESYEDILISKGPKM